MVLSMFYVWWGPSVTSGGCFLKQQAATDLCTCDVHALLVTDSCSQPSHLLRQRPERVVQPLAERSQVRQTAGPHALVRVLGSPQEDAHQRVA